MNTVTKAFDVPLPDSKEAKALATLLGQDSLDGMSMGLLVGYAAGKAAAMLPDAARIIRVVVVAQLGPKGTDS
jgi:hypothetical protein